MAEETKEASIDVDYYDCQPSDELTHTEVDAAVYAYLEYFDPPFPSEVTARAYRRQVVSAADKKSLVENITEGICESLDEEFGNPEGDRTYVSNDAYKLAEAFVELVVKDYDVWVCEHVPSEDVTVNTAAWIRENEPCWISDSPMIRAEVERLEKEEKDELLEDSSD